MKPYNPYQGPAPAAMGMMGQGLIEAGANIGRTMQRGYESLGQGISKGVSDAISAYGDYKKMESGVKASEKAYDTFREFLEPDVQKSIDTRIAGMNQDTSLSLQDKAAFWELAKGFMGGAINQRFALDKQQKELNARAGLQESQIAAENWRELQRIDAQSRAPYQRAEADSLYPGGGGSGGGLFMPQSFTLGPGQQQAPQQPAMPAQINMQYRRKGK